MAATKKRRLFGPAAPCELCEPGTRGTLQLRAHTDEHGTIEHSGEYVYAGLVRGFHVFAPVGDSPVLFLDRSEVVTWKPTR
jgi:hypothetical protein